MSIANKKPLLYIVNENGLDGASRTAYEVSSQLTKFYDVTVIVPLVPRYRFFILYQWKSLGSLKSFFARLNYILRSLARELIYWKFSWILEQGEEPFRIVRCLFRANKTLVTGAHKVILNHWYHVLDLPDVCEHQNSKFLIYHHHYEQYDDSDLNTMKDRVFDSTKTITYCKESQTQIAKKVNHVPRVVFPGINQSYFYSGKERTRSIDVALYRGFEPRKGYEVGLSALEKVREVENIRCCIIQGSSGLSVPDGYERFSELKAMELGHLLRKIDVFVFPSLYEGFGYPPLEAMACGCAVVTTAVGAIEEYATHLKSAYIVPPGSAEEIAQGILFFLRNQDTKNNIQQDAAKASRLFTWENAGIQINEFLEET